MFTNVHQVLGKCFRDVISNSWNQSKRFSRSTFNSNFFGKGFRPPVKKTSKPQVVIEENNEEPKELDNSSFENELNELIDRAFIRPQSGHQVFVIQPVIKWGRLKKRNTTPQLQLLESVTLIKTLRQWKVVGELIITLSSFSYSTFFKKGNLEKLRDMVHGTPTISAVFISVDTLKLHQQMALQKIFGVPVYDRYTIIMHIFREHAQTKEAKLQVQLAELPYLWQMLKGFDDGIGEKLGGGARYFGISGPKSLEDRKEIFRDIQAKIKRQILEVREHRDSFRKKREESEIPVVAVIGYTNAGKTSLVKALSGKTTLEPKDYLFATLDVTCHIGELPSSLKVFYVDTLGFISDIPTYLIESFISTLEDAVTAQVIIHVRDISHPDTVAQNENVLEILQQLNLSEADMEKIITVGNKMDLVDENNLKNYSDDMILVSCADLTGIDVLKQTIEKRILMLEDKTKMVIRVKSGGEEYDWLHSSAVVVEESPDPKDNQFMLVRVIISKSALAKFKHYFIENYKSNKR